MDPAASVGNVVTGSIDGKFEQGYLVTVEVGNEKLRGVVYHVPPGCGSQFARIPCYSRKETPEEKKRKLKEELRKDPNAPRATRTGYNFFYVEQRAKLKLLYPDKERELTRMAGEAWNRLTDEEKLVYPPTNFLRSSPLVHCFEVSCLVTSNPRIIPYISLADWTLLCIMRAAISRDGS